MKGKFSGEIREDKVENNWGRSESKGNLVD